MTESVSPRASAGEPLFCCGGCEAVYQILHNQGLDHYYDLRRMSPPACPRPVSSGPVESYQYCDDPAFISEFSADGRGLKFYLEGVQCTACLWLIEKLPDFCPGLASARLRMSDSTVEIVRDADGSFARAAQTLHRLGYKPHPVRSKDDAEALRAQENRRDLVRIGVAAAAAGNIMILAVSLYAGATGALAEQFKWMAALISLPALTFSAWPFYKSSWSALRNRRISIDVPIVMALVAGFIMSLWSLLRGGDHIYFDSLTMLVFLLSSSRFLLKRIQQHNLDADHLQDFVSIGTVTRVSPLGERAKVMPLQLVAGDLIEIEPGQVVPADGEVHFGSGLLNTSIITGESMPRLVRVGDSVEAGCRNENGTFQLQVTARGAETRFARILKDAEASSQNKPKILHLADRIGEVFTVVVMVASGILIGAFAMTDPQEGLSRALALVIVSCPCVFGMAIPLSLSLALRESAKKGVFIKNADALERLTQVEEIYFDKTGTLTEGDLEVVRLDLLEPDTTHLSAALALEIGESHPVAIAIRRHLPTRHILPIRSIENKAAISAGGVSATVAGSRYELRPLTEAEIQQNLSTPSPDLSTDEPAARDLKGVYGLICDGRLVVRFFLRDRVRPDAPAIVTSLKGLGLGVHVLSGDRASVVAACAREAGIPDENAHAGLRPEEKVAAIRRSPARSAMVGDGANDAGALAAASVGIAVRGCMEVSLRAADVYIMYDSLKNVPALVERSRRTFKSVRRNLFFTASYNLIGAGLAVAGLMNPLLAAILMPLSSLTVLGSSWLGSRERTPR